MKRILLAALAFVGLGSGAALAQSYGGTDEGSTPGVPASTQPNVPAGTDVAPGPGNQTDSDQPAGTNPNGSMNDQNDLPNMPGTGRSGSELPDLGTPQRNLGEPDTSSSDMSSPDQTASPNSMGPTYDEGTTQLPSSPTNTPDVNR